MSERRYNEEEVRAIFERATSAQQAVRRELPASDGLTLEEVQAIGAEVGIPAALVRQAARSLDLAGTSHTRRLLGLPIGVGRTVELGRKLSDEEWERLVVELRETFDARGRVRADGSLRQWTNGNLQALLEPTPNGHRLRLRTIHGSSRAFIAAGVAFAGTGVATLLASLLSGGSPDGTIVRLLLAGIGMFSVGAIRLPLWASTRRRQMESIASRLALENPEPSEEE